MKTRLSALISILAFPVFAQLNVQSMLPAGSGTILTTSYQLEWSIGELTTIFVSTDKGSITHGILATGAAVVITATDEDASQYLMISPNPFSETIFVEAMNIHSGTLDFTLLDLLGREVPLKIEKGGNQTRLVIQREIPPGFYILCIYDQAKKMEFKNKLIKS